MDIDVWVFVLKLGFFGVDLIFEFLLSIYFWGGVIL